MTTIQHRTTTSPHALEKSPGQLRDRSSHTPHTTPGEKSSSNRSSPDFYQDEYGSLSGCKKYEDASPLSTPEGPVVGVKNGGAGNKYKACGPSLNGMKLFLLALLVACVFGAYELELFWEKGQRPRGVRGSGRGAAGAAAAVGERGAAGAAAAVGETKGGSEEQAGKR